MTSKAPLATDLRARVRTAIINHELAPGSRINELQLSAKLKVSRTPLREALRNLEQEGLVSLEHNRGFFIPDLSASEVRELYPMIWALESVALELSGPLVFTLPVELERINIRFQKSADSPKAALKADEEFHTTLLSRTPNKRLMRTISQLKFAMARYEHLYMKEPSLVLLSARQHQLIIDALNKADLVGAQAALVSNWKFGMEILIRNIEQAGR